MYLLILIIVGYLIFYKYNKILGKVIEDNKDGFKNYEKKNLDPVGIKIEVPEFTKYYIITGEYNTIPYYLSVYFSFIFNNNIKLNITKNIENDNNINYVNKNKYEFGICHENQLLEKKKLDNVSFICALNKEYLYFIVNDNSNINSLSDLKNKKIGISSSNSNSFNVLQKLCDTERITLSKSKKKDSLYYIEKDINTNFNLFLQKKIDCLFYISGHNLPYIKSLAEKTNIRLLDIKSDLFDKIEGQKFKKIKINIENYNTNNDNFYLETFYTRNILICNNKLDNKLIYNITKNIYNNIDKIKDNLKKIGKKSFQQTEDPFYSDFNISHMAFIDSKINIHGGAYQYYKEIDLIIDKKKRCNFYKTKCELMPFNEIKNYWKYNTIDGDTVDNNEVSEVSEESEDSDEDGLTEDIVKLEKDTTVAVK